MRRSIGWVSVFTTVVLASGCGGNFKLPTETPGGAVPGAGTYSHKATWEGFTGVQDLLINEGRGDEFFVLFNNGGSGGPSVPRGGVAQFQRTAPIVAPLSRFVPPTGLFNPVAIAASGRNLFVLDQGDSCQAKFDARRNTCEPDADTTNATGHPFRSQIFDYTATWRVREYTKSGGDTVSTFTDSTVILPYGIAVDGTDRIYVAGLTVVLDTSQTNASIRTRKFASRVYRYVRGPKYPGIRDVNMPGTASWHRDTTWFAVDGTGASSVSDPRGIRWSLYDQNTLMIADRGNNEVKGISTSAISVPIVLADGQTTGANFNHPEAVAVDLNGSFYVIDRDSRRVLRYDRMGSDVLRVDTTPNANGETLLDPVGIAVNDTLVYVADRARRQIVIFRRTQ